MRRKNSWSHGPFLKRAALIFLPAATLLAAEYSYRAFLSLTAGQPVEAGRFEVYVIGESTAWGMPYAPQIGFPEIGARMLGGRIAGKTISIRNLAQPGHTIHSEAALFRRAMNRRRGADPGIVLIYCGHNDAVFSGSKAPPAVLLLQKLSRRSLLVSDALYLAEKKFRVYHMRKGAQAYEDYLREIIETALERGLTPIVSTLIGNVSGVDPGLFPGDALTTQEVRSVVRRGEELERRKAYRQAISFYTENRGSPALRPYMDFRIGHCFRALNEPQDANRHYWKAIDEVSRDNFRRASSRQNSTIERLAAEYGVPLVNAVKVFEENSPDGLVGDELFSDGHHPNIEGYALLARAFAEASAKAVGEPFRGGRMTGADVLRSFSYGSKEQAAALAFSGWWFISVAQEHLHPGPRLESAGRNFTKAVALNADDLRAWLGLGMTEAALKGGVPLRAEDLAWMNRHGLLDVFPLSIPEAALEEVLAKFRKARVSETLIRRILRAYHANRKNIDAEARRI